MEALAVAVKMAERMYATEASADRGLVEEQSTFSTKAPSTEQIASLLQVEYWCQMGVTAMPFTIPLVGMEL